MDFKKEYKKLLGIAKNNLLQAGKPCRNEDIAKKLGYTRSYFSQLIGEKGVITKDHINTFKLHFKEMLENTTSDEIADTEQTATSKDLSSLIESNLTLSRAIEKNTNSLADMVQLYKEKSVPVSFDLLGLVEEIRQLHAKVDALLRPQIEQAEQELREEAGKFVDDRDKEAFEIAQRFRQSGKHGSGKSGKK